MHLTKLSRFCAVALTSAIVVTGSLGVGTLDNQGSGYVVHAEEEYVYCYAGLSWSEYWESEGVYNATDVSSSLTTDTKGETDKGGYDAVTRATVNHGLHRGSFQCAAVIHATNVNDETDTKDFEVSHWSSDGATLYLTDGTSVTFNRGAITDGDKEYKLTTYEVTGTKYVPVAVKSSEFDAFKEKYDVVENGGNLVGGYGENNLSAYTATANVTKDTNGLKTVSKKDDGTFTFSARKTGTDSGVTNYTLSTDQTSLEKVTNIVTTVKEADGSYGEFLRVDLTGTDYGKLGSSMQAVKWTYYGSDATRQNEVISYGTKFAADNWMHKKNGIQLGLTESARCKLPDDTDGTGYWSITVYGLGYEDYTTNFEVTQDNIVKEQPDATAEELAGLKTVIDQAQGLKESDYCATSYKAMETELAEAKEAYETTGVKQAVVAEAQSHLQDAIKALEKHEYKTTVTKATQSADGVITTTCTKCNTKTETKIAKITSVALNKKSFTYNNKVQKPTVTVKDSNGKVIAASNYTVSTSNSKNPGAYTLKITFKGNYSGTSSQTYTISPAKTTLKLSKATKKSWKATWKKVAGVTGYELSYSTKSSMKGAKTIKVSAKSASKTIKKLKKNKKYYVRVRSYKTVKVNNKNTNLYSAYSAKKSIKTKKK